MILYLPHHTLVTNLTPQLSAGLTVLAGAGRSRGVHQRGGSVWTLYLQIEAEKTPDSTFNTNFKSRCFCVWISDKASEWRYTFLDTWWDSGWDQTTWHHLKTETMAYEWGRLLFLLLLYYYCIIYSINVSWSKSKLFTFQNHPCMLM